ncbi:MAG: paraquat-inducible protein A [Burkholderiaceae bacterium]|nr:paraquat-inducible protein A [Burkholderiaceae bacterium]
MQVFEVEPAPTVATAGARGLWRCSTCTHLWPAPVGSLDSSDTALLCGRCGTAVLRRTSQSIASSWALLIAAAILYIPANVLPVMHTHTLMGDQNDTIFSGIVYLWMEGSWPLALVVFVASIAVPLGKLLALSHLLLSVQRGSIQTPIRSLRQYRLLEVVGRWSMLDIYVISLLSALVQIQSMASIQPGPGAAAFGAVVVLTMMATHQFDPRLIWDRSASVIRDKTIVSPQSPPART